MAAPFDFTKLVQVLELVRGTVLPFFPLEGLFVANVGQGRRWQRAGLVESVHLSHGQETEVGKSRMEASQASFIYAARREIDDVS